MQMIIKAYSELSQLRTFRERFEYLKIGGSVGVDTFGFDRYLNQIFYKTIEWRRVRDFVIVRDLGCDLGMRDHEINGEIIIIHHMNTITKDDIISRSEYLLNPEYLITTKQSTHNAIHYGDESLLKNLSPIQRTRNDTCPWKR